MDDNTKNTNEENDDLEIHANLKGFNMRAGGGWKKYLGPWLGPIVLVAVLGLAIGVIITTLYAVKVVMP